MISVNRTELRVWEWGALDAPVVLCAHGAYDHGRMFDGLAPRLVDAGYRVLSPDLRGHGDSGPINTGLTFEASVLDLASLAAEQTGPVGLLGHSMGASMLLGVAAVFPDRVRWVVTLDGLGPPGSQINNEPIDEVARSGWATLVKTLGRSRRLFPDALAMKAQRGTINTRMPDEWLEHLVEHGTTEVDGGRVWKWDPLFNTWLPDGFEVSWVTDDFDQVSCPVLAIMGGADDMWSFPADELADRSRHLRDLELHVLDDAGHYVHLEQPDAVMSRITAFLDRVGP